MERYNREEYPIFQPATFRIVLPRDRPRFSPPPEEEFQASQPRIQMPIYQPRFPPPVQAYQAPPEYVYREQARGLIAQLRRDARNAEIRRRRAEQRAQNVDLEDFFLAELFEELPVAKRVRTRDDSLRREIHPPKRFRYDQLGIPYIPQ